MNQVTYSSEVIRPFHTEVTVILGCRTYTHNVVIHVYSDGRIDIDLFGRKTILPGNFEITKY